MTGLPQACGITAMPTFHVYRGGARVGELCGAEEPKLRALIARHAAAAAGGTGGKRAREEVASEGTAPKPIKWKKIIAKELKTCGGKMGLKALKKACVAEVRAHPSHTGRDKEEVRAEFDAVLPTFHKFKQVGGQVCMADESAGAASGE